MTCLTYIVGTAHISFFNVNRDLLKIVEDCERLKRKSVLKRTFQHKNDENTISGFNDAFDRAVDRFTVSSVLLN